MKTKLAVLSLFLAAVCTAPLLAGFNEIAVSSYDFTPEPGAGWPEDPARTKLTDNVVPAAGENWSANKTVGWELPIDTGPTVTFDLGQSYEIDMVSLTHFGSYYGFQTVTISTTDDPNAFELIDTFDNALLDTTEKGESVTQDILLTAPGRFIKMEFISGEPGYPKAWTMLSEVEFFQLDPNTILIQKNPKGLTLIEGGSGELSVTATGKTLPISYQWKKDGIEIPGATEAVLLIEAATVDDSGAYTCVVTSPANAVGEESAAAVVNVVSAAPLTDYGMRVFNHAPAVYWSFDEAEGPAVEMMSLLGNRMLTADQPVRVDNGALGNAISVQAFENVFGTTTLNSDVDTMGPFALEFWVRIADPTVRDRYIMEAGFPGGGGSKANLPAAIYGYNPMELELFGSGYRSTGFTYEDPNEWTQWHHVVLVDYDDEIEAYNNGVKLEGFDYRDAAGNLRLYLGGEIAIGSVKKTNADSRNAVLQGDIDEVAIYDFTGMEKEAIRARAQAIALHSDMDGPAYITEQPRDTVAPPTTDAVLSIAAAGAEPISYQWKKNGVEIPGANAAVLVLPGVQPGLDGGVYTCSVENAEGSEESAAAVLTVACYYDIPGDINDDCIVDLLDLATVAAHWLEDSSVLP